MTRLNQWLMRRAKNIWRGRTKWNARPRGDRGPWYLPPTGRPQHAGGWTFGGEVKLKYPVLRNKTLKKQIYDLTHPTNVVQVGTIGYQHPPHYKNTLGPWHPFYPTIHADGNVNSVMHRNVLRRQRKPNRARGSDYVCYVAWVYWKKRGVWPTWDPKHRTPVDTVTPGPDDIW